MPVHPNRAWQLKTNPFGLFGAMQQEDSFTGREVAKHFQKNKGVKPKLLYGMEIKARYSYLLK
jgi:hypothetical protein